MLIANISAAPSGTYLFDNVKVTNHNINATMSLKAYQHPAYQSHPYNFTVPDNVYVDIKYTGLIGGDQSVSIEKVLNADGESRLKITTVYITANPNNNNNENVEYVDTGLSPKEYYFKVYKPSRIDSFLGSGPVIPMPLPPIKII